MHSLRYYQTAALEKTWEWMQVNDGNPLIVLPTGTGKALIAAKLAQEVVAWRSNCLVLAHVRELVGQNYLELLEQWPDAPAGIYSAGLKKKDVGKPITIASIQSIWKKAALLRKIELIIVDECHLIPRSSETMYGSFLAAMKLINPDVKIIGLTATPFRMDSGRLDQGEDRIFHGISYEYSIRQAIDDGFLCPPMSKDTTMHLSTAGVGSRGGEFIPGELMRAVDTGDNNEKAVDEIVRLGDDRRAWLVFCSGTDHSLHIRDLMRGRGITAEALSADTESNERARIISEFKRGNTRCLISMNLLMTGFNVPMVDLIAMLRPTKSVVVYIQTVGRGTRIYPGNKIVLVLDFAKNVIALRAYRRCKHKGTRERAGAKPQLKICPDCSSICHASVRTCKDCGFVFPEPETKITAAADTAPVISIVDAPKWVGVNDVNYSRHEKYGAEGAAPPTLKVSYLYGSTVYSEWLCFEHNPTSWAAGEARKWWLGRGGGYPIPSSVDQALSRTREIRKPAEILVQKQGKYWKIKGHRERTVPDVLEAGEGGRFYSTSSRSIGA